MQGSLSSLKSIADELDRLGLYMQADLIDAAIIRYAQNAPAVSPDPGAAQDMGPPPPAAPTAAPVVPEAKNKYKAVRTTYMMFKKLKEMYATYLPSLDYLGGDNIKAILNAFDQLLLIFEAVLRDKPSEFNNDELQYFNGQLKRHEAELKRSMRMRPTPLKLKVDQGCLFSPLSNLTEKLKRHYDGGLKELNPVVRKARSLQNAFSNVVQTISAQIEHSDLIELS